MNLHAENLYHIEAPPAIEINVRPNILYTEEYSYLTRDELEVLFLLATTEMFADGFTSFSFSGIKRQLGKHQQKITKAVNRLVSKELISKTETGYSISAKGTNILSEIVKIQNAFDLHKSSDSYIEQRIIFNDEISLDEIAIQLIGKWFGSFRYLSHTEGKQFVIRWQLVDSRASATLRIYPGEAIINVIPDKNDLQNYSYEEALEQLSQYLIEILISLGLHPSIDFEGWRTSTISELDYQEKLASWLRTYRTQIHSEN
ncbi:MAG: hypothetical protein ACFFDW_09060 [Candidatus Thorarchaeota archaeon]